MKTTEKLIEMNRNESPTLPHPSGIQTQPHKLFKELEGEKKYCDDPCALLQNHISGGETPESVFSTNCLSEFNASKCSAGQCWWWVSTFGAH